MCAKMSWKTIKTVSVHWVWCLIIWLGLRRSFLLDLRRLQSSSSSCLVSAGALQTYGEADCDVAGREKKAWRKEAEMEERFFTRMLCWEEKFRDYRQIFHYILFPLAGTENRKKFWIIKTQFLKILLANFFSRAGIDILSGLQCWPRTTVGVRCMMGTNVCSSWSRTEASATTERSRPLTSTTSKTTQVRAGLRVKMWLNMTQFHSPRPKGLSRVPKLF